MSPSPRTRVRRSPERGRYDRDTVHAVLDEGFVCHLAFVQDGQPYAIPTGYGRDGDRLLVHGSAASRAMRLGRAGAPLCVTVTLLDGLVLARSAMHQSMNYRSVVVLGVASEIVERDDKVAALRCITEHIVPGRWEDIRPPSPEELRATTVLALPLDECSAKVRSGPPLDDPEDLDLPVWAGVLPLGQVAGEPLQDPAQPAAPAPGYVAAYGRSRVSPALGRAGVSPPASPPA